MIWSENIHEIENRKTLEQSKSLLKFGNPPNQEQNSHTSGNHYLNPFKKEEKTILYNRKHPHTIKVFTQPRNLFSCL